MPAEVEGLIGIDHLQMGICDERHTLELFRFYENYEEAAEQLKFQVDDEGFDQAAFDRGEQIILVTGSYFPSAYISEGGMRENGIICGQQVEIGSRDTDGKTSVTVGAIIKDPENGSGKMSWDFGNRPYGIIGSVKLAERIAQTDGGKDIMENSVAILLNRQASYEATDKQLASLFQKNGLEYGSYRDYVNGVWNRMVRDVCIYGIFGIVVAAVFLVLLLNFRKNQSFYMDRDYRLLRRMGMERQYFCRLLRSDTRKQALWLLAGAPLAYAEILFVFYMKTLADAEWDIQQGQYGVSFSTILNAYTDNPFWWAVELTGRNTAWYCTAAALILVIAVFLLSSEWAARRIEKGADQENPPCSGCLEHWSLRMRERYFWRERICPDCRTSVCHGSAGAGSGLSTRITACSRSLRHMRILPCPSIWTEKRRIKAISRK